MYIATIKNKEFINGILKVTVDFSDGTTTITESCIPQDFNGLKFWVKSRLDTLNGGKEIDSTFSIDDQIDPTEPISPVVQPTQEELDRQEWFVDYNKWLKVKNTLINTGVLTGNEVPVVALLNKVKNGFKATYLTFM